MKNKHLTEFNEYVRNTSMTDEEQQALKEWVLNGYSVHDNPSMATDEQGNPIDYLEDFRYHQEIYMTLNSLSGKEKEMYLARLRGEDTIDTLREDLQTVSYEGNVYRQVLARHGLLEEANQRIEAGKSMTYDYKTDELPFQ